MDSKYMKEVELRELINDILCVNTKNRRIDREYIDNILFSLGFKYNQKILIK